MTQQFEIMMPGSALSDAPSPASPKAVSHTGAPANPSAAALAERFPMAVERTVVTWGETVVFVRPGSVLEIMQWLHDDPTQQYDYLSDVTAVEYRDFDQPLEVVCPLRSLPFRRFLRVKVQLPKSGPLEVPSVWSIWKSADWLRGGWFGPFGLRFTGP